jgi:hypothetical protein
MADHFSDGILNAALGRLVAGGLTPEQQHRDIVAALVAMQEQIDGVRRDVSKGALQAIVDEAIRGGATGIQKLTDDCTVLLNDLFDAGVKSRAQANAAIARAHKAKRRT